MLWLFLKNNYIIPNAHVVENTDNLKIELINGKKYSPTIIGKISIMIFVF